MSGGMIKLQNQPGSKGATTNQLERRTGRSCTILGKPAWLELAGIAQMAVLKICVILKRPSLWIWNTGKDYLQ